ncbi:MAG: hypothetical protein J7576_19775, partial [Siphonobacter aquaeclarae]|nr:hypothetical protein [Siphonobacter aquaeclarae]
ETDLIVNEAGASVYSASKLAQEEFPDLDVADQVCQKKQKKERRSHRKEKLRARRPVFLNKGLLTARRRDARITRERSAGYSSRRKNTSSTFLPKTAARRMARMVDGTYLPFSIEITACLDTETLSASSACVI